MQTPQVRESETEDGSNEDEHCLVPGESGEVSGDERSDQPAEVGELVITSLLHGKVGLARGVSDQQSKDDGDEHKGDRSRYVEQGESP